MTRNPCVLIIEDEAIIAMDMETELRSRGWSVLGPAGTVGAATAILDAGHRPDVAALDVNLRNQTSFGVAERLMDLGVPFLFLTGDSATDRPATLQNAPVLSKPIDFDAFISALNGLMRSPA